MNTYRVKFFTCHILSNGKVDTRTIRVSARGDLHAVAEATMLAMGGTGNADADQIGEWMRDGAVVNVYAVIETN